MHQRLERPPVYPLAGPADPPLVRKDGVLVESTWEEALQIIADKMMDIKSRFGPQALAFLSSAKVTNEENFLFMKLARAVFRTNNIDHCARL